MYLSFLIRVQKKRIIIEREQFFFFLLPPVIIHSDAKWELDVSSNLTGLGYLPGYLKVCGLNPTKGIFFSFYTYENFNLCLSFLSSFSPITRYTRQKKPNIDVVFLSMVAASSLYIATYDILICTLDKLLISTTREKEKKRCIKWLSIKER